MSWSFVTAMLVKQNKQYLSLEYIFRDWDISENSFVTYYAFNYNKLNC